MTLRTPQVLIVLTPDGGLAAELPGANGSRRKVQLSLDSAGAAILRMLQGQSTEGPEIGHDGAPTQAQVKHWEKHAVWASSSCRFCLAEGRAKPEAQRAKARAKAQTKKILRRADGVEVRRLPERVSGATVLETTPEELGL